MKEYLIFFTVLNTSNTYLIKRISIIERKKSNGIFSVRFHHFFLCSNFSFFITFFSSFFPCFFVFYFAFVLYFLSFVEKAYLKVIILTRL